MKLIDYWNKLDTEGRETVAAAANTNRIYLYQLAHGYRQASPLLARRIEEATKCAVTRYDLRPDVFGKRP